LAIPKYTIWSYVVGVHLLVDLLLELETILQ